MLPDLSLSNYYESVMNEKNSIVDDLQPSMIKQKQWEMSSDGIRTWISASDEAYAASKGMQLVIQRVAKVNKNEGNISFAEFRCLRVLKGVPMLICDTVICFSY